MRPPDHEGCRICQAHGDPKSGWVTVYRPHPAEPDHQRDSRGKHLTSWRKPIIVSGAIRCPCWPHLEPEGSPGYDLAEWLRAWGQTLEWHRWAIENSPKDCQHLDQISYERQQELAAKLLGAVRA